MSWIIPCQTCGRKALWFRIKKRTVNTPIGQVTSKKTMCPKCYSSIRRLDDINRNSNQK